MTTASEQSTPGTRRPAPRRRRGPFGGHVAASVAQLQQRYLGKKDARAVATMAHLRAAVGRAPAESYAVLAVTSVPDPYLESFPSQEPTDTEHAKHAALTLYAVHQQSIYDRPMHVDGRGLGTAVEELSRATDSAEAIRRRFAALGTASTYDETLFHLRSLVHQMREHRTSLDYGLLAEDLVALRGAGGHERVRAWWGRDYYRSLAPDVSTDPAGTTPTPPPPPPPARSDP